MIKNLDFISSGPSLLINRKKTSQSNLGAVLSILIGIGVFLFTWFLGNSIVYKDQPQLLIQNDQFPKAEPYNLNVNNSFFGMAFTTAFATEHPRFYDSIEINASFLKNKVNSDGDVLFITETFPIPLETCNREHDPSYHMTDETLSVYKCLPRNYSLDFQGDFSELEQSFLIYQISVCKNKTDEIGNQAGKYANLKK